jgi:hypothetical protein
MLHNCTWQAFLIAAVVFSLVWLAVILLLFYRKELNAFLSGKVEKPVEPLRHAWADDFEAVPDEGLMGKPALQDGVSVLEQDEFSFAPSEFKESNENAGADELLQSDVFDLMENIKPLLGNKVLGKEDFIDQVNDYVHGYSKLVKSPLLDSVYELICEQVNASDLLEFELSAEELKENL